MENKRSLLFYAEVTVEYYGSAFPVTFTIKHYRNNERNEGRGKGRHASWNVDTISSLAGQRSCALNNEETNTRGYSLGHTEDAKGKKEKMDELLDYKRQLQCASSPSARACPRCAQSWWASTVAVSSLARGIPLRRGGWGPGVWSRGFSLMTPDQCVTKIIQPSLGSAHQ